MLSFLSYFNAITALSADANVAIAVKMQREEFPKGHLLIPELSKCSKLYFIEQGLVRAYFYHEGKDITDWFAFENFIFGPVIRNFPTKNTPHAVETLEKVVVYSIPFSDLEQLYKTHHDIERLGRLIAIQTIVHLQQKIDSQLLNAKERYENFINTYPSLLQRANLGHIASFLDMNQVTLSRIRKQ